MGVASANSIHSDVAIDTWWSRIPQPQVAAHFQSKKRCCQDGADRKASHHVPQLGTGAFCFRSARGFERHSTDRTTAGFVALNLRVHRTGVEGVLGFLPASRRPGSFAAMELSAPGA